MTLRPVRVGLFAASPVYFQVPLYRRLAADPRIDFTAIYASSTGVRAGALGFGAPVAFDVDMLSGYESVFLRRADRNEITGSLLALRDFDVVGAVLRGRYDVLWLHGWYSLTHLLAAAAQVARGGRLLIREDQTVIHPRPLWKQAFKQPLLRLLFSRAHGLTVGTENRRWFVHHGMPDERLHVVPNCVDVERISAETARLRPERPRLLERLGAKPDADPVILMVARLIPKKQPQLLLEAFRRVRAERRCTLVIVGSGELESELRAQIERQAIPDVVLAGFLNQSEIAAAYAAADIFVLPSAYDETWGVVVNEAMSAGLPVVVSDKVGSTADLVRDGVNGFVVRSDAPDELATRLAALVDSPELRAQLGRESRRMIEGFTYDAATDGLLAGIAAAAGERRWRAASGDAGDRRAAHDHAADVA